LGWSDHQSVRRKYSAEARDILPETPVIILTGHATVLSAVEAMKQGAFDYLTKPINPEELLLIIRRAAERSLLQREVRRLRKQVEDRGGLAGMVGHSESMLRVFEQIQQVAPTRSTDLITGESSTGKELVARALHQLLASLNFHGTEFTQHFPREVS
jgi:DNA-binding NtrC family response regulator